MFDVIVDCDSQVAEEMSDWCDWNLDGFMGYVTRGTGLVFFFDTKKEANVFEEVLGEFM